MVNVGRFIVTIILIIILLSIAAALYPTFQDTIDNVTGEGYAGTALLVVASVIYWILVATAVILGLLKGLGLQEIIRDFKKF